MSCAWNVSILKCYDSYLLVTVHVYTNYLRLSSFHFEITVTTDLLKWVPIGNQARKVCMKRKKSDKLAIISYKESTEINKYCKLTNEWNLLYISHKRNRNRKRTVFWHLFHLFCEAWWSEFNSLKMKRMFEDIHT